MKALPSSIKGFLGLVLLFMIFQPHFGEYLTKQSSMDPKKEIVVNIIRFLENEDSSMQFTKMDCTPSEDDILCVFSMKNTTAIHKSRFHVDSYILNNNYQLLSIDSLMDRRRFLKNRSDGSKFLVDIRLQHRAITIRVENFNQ